MGWVSRLDYKRAKTDEEKSLCLGGIPRKYWGATQEEITFLPVAIDAEGKHVSMSGKRQSDLFSSISFEEPGLLAIGSKPTDHAALFSVVVLIRRANALGLKWVLINSSEVQHADPEAEILIIINLVTKSTDFRLQAVRDAISRRTDRLSVLVIGGEDPLAFCTAKLSIMPDITFFVEAKEAAIWKTAGGGDE